MGRNQTLCEDTDRLLLGKVVACDTEAIRKLYFLYHRRLVRFLMRFTRHKELAEEVINDTFWVVWRNAGEFRGDSRVSTWIMGIAYRAALKKLRGTRRHSLDAVPIENEPLPGPDELDTMETREWIRRAMQRLPIDQRRVLELAYGHGHSCEEIARIVDCPVNTVKARMFLARSKLRVLLPKLAGTGRAS